MKKTIVLILLIVFLKPELCTAQQSEFSRILNSLNKTMDSGEYVKSLQLIDTLSGLISPANVWYIMDLLSRKASVYYKLGYYNQALEGYNAVHSIIQNNYPQAYILLSENYEKLGDVYIKLNKLSDAKIQYHLSINSLINSEQKNLRDKDKIARLYLKLAKLSYTGKNYKTTLNYLDSCSEIAYKNLESLSPIILELRAKSYIGIGNYSEGEEYFMACEKYYVEKIDPLNYRLSALYSDIASFYRAIRKFENSINYRLKAIYISLENFGKKHPLTAKYYRDFADDLYMDRRYESALKYYQSSMIASIENFNSTNHYNNPGINDLTQSVDLINVLLQKASIFELLSRQNQSRDYKYEKLAAAYNTLRLSLDYMSSLKSNYIDSGMKQFIINNESYFYSKAIRILHKKNALNNSEQNIKELYRTINEAKVSDFQNEVIFDDDYISGFLTDSLILVKNEISERIETYDLLIKKEKEKLASNLNRIDNWENRKNALLNSYNDLIDEGGSELLSYFQQIKELKYLEIEKLQNDLNHNETLIDYYISDIDHMAGRECIIVIITKTNLVYRHIYISNSLINDITDIHKFIHLSSLEHDCTGNYSLTNLENDLYGVFNLLIKPFEQYFSGRNLIIIPHHQLFYIPWEFLIKTRSIPKNQSQFSDKPYLINEYNIRYGTVSTLLFQDELSMEVYDEIKFVEFKNIRKKDLYNLYRQNAVPKNIIIKVDCDSIEKSIPPLSHLINLYRMKGTSSVMVTTCLPDTTLNTIINRYREYNNKGKNPSNALRRAKLDLLNNSGDVQFSESGISCLQFFGINKRNRETYFFYLLFVLLISLSLIVLIMNLKGKN